MNLSVPTRNAVLEVVYELIWISVIVMALICGLFFGVPKDAIAQNFVESPEFESRDNTLLQKEQYEIPNSKMPPLLDRNSDEKFEGGALHTAGQEQKIGETSDCVLSNEEISESVEEQKN